MSRARFVTEYAKIPYSPMAESRSAAVENKETNRTARLRVAYFLEINALYVWTAPRVTDGLVDARADLIPAVNAAGSATTRTRRSPYRYTRRYLR
jgi:hypothetical protein